MFKLEWDHPLIMGNASLMGNIWGMSIFGLLMKPENQMKMWQSMFTPMNYTKPKEK
jgi:hypothetical protein